MQQLVGKLLVLLVAGSSQVCYAQTEAFSMRGYGTMQCADAVKSLRTRDEDELLIVTWTYGLHTGLNTAKARDNQVRKNLPEIEPLKLMLERECLERPQERLFIAALRVFDKLSDSSRPHPRPSPG